MTNGEVAEWSIAPVLKTGIPERGSRVRISPSPQNKEQKAKLFVTVLLRGMGRDEKGAGKKSGGTKTF
jgi:hypothetical protein